MIYIAILAVTTAIVILAIRQWQDRTVPHLLKEMLWLLNHKSIPHELSLLLPEEYTCSEGYSMSASVKPIFVDKGRRPMWRMSIVLVDPLLTSTVELTFDKSGNLYE